MAGLEGSAQTCVSGEICGGLVGGERLEERGAGLWGARGGQRAPPVSGSQFLAGVT